MKKLITLGLSSSLLLAACGTNNNESDSSNKETDVKTEEKITTEKPTTEKPTTEEPTNEQATTEEVTTEEVTTEAASTEQPAVNFNNVTDQVTLENIIYGNYAELDKIAAYNSAVANGVIPQGTVMEGPAAAAYESSVALQNGKSEKEQMAEKYQAWVDAGIFTPEQMKEELAKFDK